MSMTMIQKIEKELYQTALLLADLREAGKGIWAEYYARIALALDTTDITEAVMAQGRSEALLNELIGDLNFQHRMERISEGV